MTIIAVGHTDRDTIIALKDREKKLVEFVQSLTITDTCESPTGIWLSQWRNDAKKRAREVLKELGIK